MQPNYKEVLRRVVRDRMPERVGPNEWNPVNRLIYGDHIIRYQFAEQFVGGADALDIACGLGYRSNLLARSAKSVIGVDIAEEAINDARKRYPLANLQFIQSDGIEFLKSEGHFDVICSFETVEHIDKYEEFVQLLGARLRPKGKLVISTPNKAYGELLFGGPMTKYHIREFETNEFCALLRTIFGNEPKIYRQRRFSKRHKMTTALLASADPRSKIQSDKAGTSSMIDIFVVQK